MNKILLMLVIPLGLMSCGGGGGDSSTLPPIVSDVTPPVIVLNGGDSSLFVGANYSDPGATATDAVDGSVAVSTSGTVDTGTVGTYVLTYTASDSSGNTSSQTRNITVSVIPNTPDVTAPVITLNAGTSSVEVGDTYVDPGVIVVDDRDGVLTATTTGSVDTSVVGSNTITYSAVDNAGNTSSQSRTVSVVDTGAPVIVLNGGDIILPLGTAYSELSATATDAVSNNLPVLIQGAVDINTPGLYVITYTATDASGNSSSVNRNVTVEEHDFILFNPGFTTVGVTEEYTVSGKYENNVNFSGTYTNSVISTSFPWLLNATGFVTRVNARLADSLNVTMDTGVYYYRPNILEGLSSNVFNTTDIAGPSVMPVKASIGDSGSVGTYKDTAGIFQGDKNTAVVTWKLLEVVGDPNKAVLEFTTIFSNDFGVVLDTYIIGYTIDLTGNRSGVNIKSSGPISLRMDLVGVRTN